MLRFALWKTIAVLALTLAAVLTVAPSLLSQENYEALKARLPGWAAPPTIVLGLDLQGGSYVMLEVDRPSVLHTQVTNLRDEVRRILREEKIAITGGIGQQSRGVQLRIADAGDRARALPKIKALSRSFQTRVGGDAPLDVTESDDGIVRVSITDAGVTDKVRRGVEQSIEVIRRRIDALGTREPSIQRQGDDRVMVQVPGLQNPQQLKDILGQTAKLEFRLVADPGQSPSETEPLEQVDQPGTILVEKQVMVEGEDLTDAQLGFDQQRNGEPIVNFRFNIRGAQKFGEVTSKNVGRLFAIVLDNKVISAPRILQPITGGQGQISGHFTAEQANNLSILLRAGALPAKLTVVEERTVGPGLGQDSIDAGKRAALVGGALVIVYMLTTYGVFGVFADLALGVHILLIFASMALLGATLTLPGIAGIVFTIGMAVDSNVLIYERIREEAHLGRSVVSALDAGFRRAFATIVDSNVTMFVAAVILYLFGSGAVRGFAVSLGLGILTSIITAVTMTRMMISLWYRRSRATKLPI